MNDDYTLAIHDNNRLYFICKLNDITHQIQDEEIIIWTLHCTQTNGTIKLFQASINRKLGLSTWAKQGMIIKITDNYEHWEFCKANSIEVLQFRKKAGL